MNVRSALIALRRPILSFRLRSAAQDLSVPDRRVEIQLSDEDLDQVAGGLERVWQVAPDGVGQHTARP